MFRSKICFRSKKKVGREKVRKRDPAIKSSQSLASTSIESRDVAGVMYSYYVDTNNFCQQCSNNPTACVLPPLNFTFYT